MRVCASQALADAASEWSKEIPIPGAVHAYASNDMPEDGEVSRCIECGVEIVSETDEGAVVSRFRRSAKEEWQDEFIPCREQFSLFGAR